MLLVDFGQIVESPSDLVRFGRAVCPARRTGMGSNRFQKVFGPSIVQEENPLAKAP